MGNQVQQTHRNQQHYQQLPNAKSQQIQLENAINTLQSMFSSVDRSVLRMILMEQCSGNIDLAVETLLAMTGTADKTVNRGATMVKQQSPSKSATDGKAKEILYDNNMRPIILADDFLQPPSYFLKKYLNITLTASSSQLPRMKETITIDPSIVARWTQLMRKYKFGNAALMDKQCKGECKGLKQCKSLIRVVFMMKLYNNLCQGFYNKYGADDGELMHEYLSRGFKDYSLIQLINDCNHLMQYHNLTQSSNLNLKTTEERNKFENMMTSYFGQCDVMSCPIIKRVIKRQDNDDNKELKSDVDVERDIVDKYHRVFFHPMN